jgi:hypothetical protein
MAPHGRSWGILLGIDLLVFDIGVIKEGDYCVKFTLRCKSDGFKFALFVVYGPTQHEHKQEFLAEMANTCSWESLPYLIGGDFNIMRHPHDKSSVIFYFKWPNLFNFVIESLDLKEIVMSGRRYTWTGPGDDPLLEKLGWVLVSTD